MYMYTVCKYHVPRSHVEHTRHLLGGLRRVAGWGNGGSWTLAMGFNGLNIHG